MSVPHLTALGQRALAAVQAILQAEQRPANDPEGAPVDALHQALRTGAAEALRHALDQAHDWLLSEMTEDERFEHQTGMPVPVLDEIGLALQEET